MRQAVVACELMEDIVPVGDHNEVPLGLGRRAQVLETSPVLPGAHREVGVALGVEAMVVALAVLLVRRRFLGGQQKMAPKEP